jgi:hypothetical protein
MKGIFAYSMLLSFLAFGNSCKKEMPAILANASIIGGDPRTGACEGGTFINIVGHPNPNDWVSGFYDIGSIPSYFHIADSAKYPICVKIAYHVNSKCGGNYVDISTIELLQ